MKSSDGSFAGLLGSSFVEDIKFETSEGFCFGRLNGGMVQFFSD